MSDVSSEQRQYIQILRTTGTAPTNRPDFNGLSSTIDIIESIARESGGNRRSIGDTITSLSRTNAKLAALIKEEKTTVEVTSNEQLHPPLPEGMALESGATDGLCSLKDEYVAFSREKSPEGFEGFHHSCFWGMLSTVAARRIVIDLARRQYTPLIVMLSARSTLYAKTDTAEVERDVLKAAGLDWLLGLTRTTPQKLLQDMAGVVPADYSKLEFQAQEDMKRQIAMSGQRGWHYNEFGKLIKSMTRASGPMSDFIELLLQISDCPDELPSGTISRGRENVMKPYLAITGTLTPASIKAVAGKNAELWSDGFLSRMLFSCPPPNTFLDRPFKRGHLAVPHDLAKGIYEWHKRLGEPKLDIIAEVNDEGKVTGYQKIWLQHLPETIYKLDDAAYDAWTKYRTALKEMIRSFGHTDFDGSYGRLSAMALRVAALAASLDENASRIEYRHWLLGQEQAEMWRSSLHELYAQVNNELTSDIPTLEEKVLEYVAKLEEKQPPSVRDVARAMHLPTKEIEGIVTILARNGALEKIPGRQSFRYKTVNEE